MQPDHLTTKSALVEKQDVTAEEISKINGYALRELAADELYTFKLAVCDNDIDRDFEVFPLATLEKLAELYVGKTVIADHSRKAENQCARIYETYIEKGQGLSNNGETYHRLIAKCYMLRLDSNKDLIAEIEAGIKKEASAGCRIASARCSVCGVDNRKHWCDHWPGKEYDGKLCYFSLENPVDAYEVSFVAVPAQPAAGITKNYGGAKEAGEINKEQVELRLRLTGSFLRGKGVSHE